MQLESFPTEKTVLNLGIIIIIAFSTVSAIAALETIFPLVY